MSGMPSAPQKTFDFCQQRAPGRDSYISGDQIGESFADWLAAEILPRYVEKHLPSMSESEKRIGYANTYKPLCHPSESSEEVGFDPHPSTERRLNAIFLVNPKIRQQMGCKEPSREYTYCDLRTLSQSTQAPAPQAPIDPQNQGLPPAQTVPQNPNNGGVR